MHSFEVHSNGISCRKVDFLGWNKYLGQVVNFVDFPITNSYLKLLIDIIYASGRSV